MQRTRDLANEDIGRVAKWMILLAPQGPIAVSVSLFLSKISTFDLATPGNLNEGNWKPFSFLFELTKPFFVQSLVCNGYLSSVFFLLNLELFPLKKVLEYSRNYGEKKCKCYEFFNSLIEPVPDIECSLCIILCQRLEIFWLINHYTWLMGDVGVNELPVTYVED